MSVMLAMFAVLSMLAVPVGVGRHFEEVSEGLSVRMSRVKSRYQISWRVCDASPFSSTKEHGSRRLK